MAEAVSGPSGQGIALKAVEVGELMANKPYAWGGKTTTGFDCSGFVSYVLTQLFPNAPFSGDVAGYIGSTRFDDVQTPAPGDIVIFPAHQGAPNHIGIVVDSAHWIGSQSSTGVKQVLLANPYWNARPHKFRRLKATSAIAVSMAFGQRRTVLA